MSDLYTEINNQTEIMAKSHKARTCVVCQAPVQDDNSAHLEIGGGLKCLYTRAV